MTRWPDFFIVGAPRCGTTSLYFYLKGHPDIFMPSVKEPNFFADPVEMHAVAEARGFVAPPGMVTTERDYLRLFKKARPGQIAGEASPSYLGYPMAAQRIWEKSPRAKIIMILRQPIERAYSEFLLGLGEKRGREQSFYEALHGEPGYIARHTEEWGVYSARGLYYEQVRRYMDAFDRDQIRVYLYEDLASDTNALVKDVCLFLEVPFDNGSFFDSDRTYYAYGAARNYLFKTMGESKIVRSLYWAMVPSDLRLTIRDRLLTGGKPKPPMDPRAREFLRPIYHEDILKLQDLIGRDLSNWLT